MSDTSPEEAVCKDLCETFAAITNSDTNCAERFLQDRDWDLTRSLDAFFEEQSKIMPKNPDVPESGGECVPNNIVATQIGKKPSDHFKFISWNIDGLDASNIMKRTKAVCDLLLAEQPDVVHLQEIIPSTLEYIQTHMPYYKCISSSVPPNEKDYFNVTLLYIGTVTYESHTVYDFPGTLMGRSLLSVKATFMSIPLLFINSHLESCASHSQERMSQLQTTFRKVLAEDSKRTVIFAGDLNLRDKEVGQGGNLPAGIEDLYVTCGSRPEVRYTWDTTRNTNIQLDGPQRFKPRCRFDRIYLRQSTPGRLTPKFFGLVGLEKVRACQCFPSDHWGLVTYFEL